MGLSNATPYAALDVPYLDPIGREVVIILVKATFEVQDDGRVVLAEQPAPIRLNDVPYDPDNIRGSLKYPTDVGVEKVGADVVVVGEAVSWSPVEVVDVAVKVRDLTAPLRVHGERFFYRGLAGVQIGPAAPFERKPIVYEKAYGGATEDWSVVEPANPAGVGVAKRAGDLVDTPAPQIEHPERPHKSASDKPPPMGTGAIMTNWSPRKEYVGTFDEAWKETRMPILPADFDPRFNNVAHPSLVLPTLLAPGDQVAILGMTLDRVFQFALPRLPVVMRARFDRSGTITAAPAPDMLLVEPSKRTFELVARTVFPVGRARDVLREVVVDVEA